MMKRLPIGISKLDKIINGGFVYVDKTHHVYNLVNKGAGYYFLSRPRRFGKSLFIDTLKQAFSGNRELFKGLYLENNWDWDVTYPVLHFTFAEGNLSSREELDEKIYRFLDDYYKEYQIENKYSEVSSCFAYLVERLAAIHKQVVVLIDEYDKPILDNIANTELAATMRDGLRNFYSVIKAQDANIQFVLLTGVSKFSKVSIFSELNNLDDLTLDSNYADICGYTQVELENYFRKYLEIGQVDKALLKKWYNGYNFAGSEAQKVYNPFDVLLFISKGYKYYSYWFETATPTFLVKLIEKNNYFIPDFEGVVVNARLLSTFEVNNMPIITLLFQTGYLTIKEVTNRGNQIAFKLSYPNYEVKYSLNDSLAEIGTNSTKKEILIADLVCALENNNFEQLELILASHFASIPNDWYRNNNIDKYEGFYASIVYSYFAALGYDLIPEDVTNHGVIDLTINMADKILIIEFKLSKYGSAEDALLQIKERGYAEKYLSLDMPIYLLGISFDAEKRNVAEIKVELLVK